MEVRSRRLSNWIPAMPSSTAIFLANLSFRTGKKIYWDAERETVVGG